MSIEVLFNAELELEVGPTAGGAETVADSGAGVVLFDAAACTVEVPAAVTGGVGVAVV